MPDLDQLKQEEARNRCRRLPKWSSGNPAGRRRGPRRDHVNLAAPLLLAGEG